MSGGGGVSGSEGRRESGFTLIELVIAIGIFSLVVVSVDVTVTMLTGRSTALSQSNQAIDQLQVAEQAIVQDVHAVTSWTTAPSSVATTLTSGLTAHQAYSSLPVASVQKQVYAGDTIVVGAGSTSDSFVAVAPGASVGASTIPVTGTPANTHSTGDAVYDAATVPLKFTAALFGTPLTANVNTGTYTSGAPATLSVSALKRAVSNGDTIVVGAGATADTLTASQAEPAGSTQVKATGTVANGHSPGDPVFDSNTTVTLSTNADSSRTLTLTSNGASSITVTNLDPSSGFSYRSTTADGTPYVTAIGVTLTMDSPRVNAPRATKTTVSDTNVEAWNVEYACTEALDAPC